MTTSKRNPSRLRIGAVTIGVAALCSLALCGPASAAPGQITFFDASRELGGEWPVASREKTLTQLDSLGVDVVRYLVYWHDVAPSPDAASPPAGFNPRDPDTYGKQGANWANVDMVVRGAAARGMDVSLVLSGQPPTGRVPRWASRDPARTQSDPDPAQFGDFAYAVGKRYSGKPGSVGPARFISVWNEPNGPLFLNSAHGENAVADLYRDLIISAKSELSAAGWAGQLLIGETGPSPPGKVLDPIPFMRHTLCLNKRFRLEDGCAPLDVAGWAHHPYSLGTPPFRPPLNPGQISYVNLWMLQKGLNRARHAGALSGPGQIYVTEFGYPSKPETFYGVTRLRQAEFDSIGEYIGYRLPGVASYAQYLMRDYHGASNNFASGLCSADTPDSVYADLGFGCKLAYASFRTPLVVRSHGRCLKPTKQGCALSKPSRRATIWGYVRAAQGPTPVEVNFRDRKGRPRLLRRVTTNAAGYFTLPVQNRPGRLWSLSWNGLKSPFVHAYAF